jgi:hypothetical protein
MDYFLLDPKTGELRTAKPLDKEALDDSTGVINITIRVSIGLCYNKVQNMYQRLVTVVTVKCIAILGIVPCNLLAMYTSSLLLLCETRIAESDQLTFSS